MTIRQALLLASMAGSAVIGWQGHNWTVYQPHLKKDLQAAERAQLALNRITAATTQISQSARDALDNRKETIRVVTKDTIKAIPVYLPELSQPQAGTGLRDGGGGAVHPGTDLPVGFGRLHDYAALGVNPPVPAPSGEPLGAASGIGLPGLAETLVTNYGLCHQDAAEVKAWREWYAREVAAWPK